MKNSIISLLNEKGYSNTGDNRSYAIRSLNTLIDAGFLKLIICSYEKSKGGYGWFWEKGGKKMRTLYKVTIFDKTYLGGFMPSKSRQRGVWGFPDVVIDIDYKSLDIYAILLRVSSLISLNKNGFDFLKDGNCNCGKCSGRGIIPGFMHYANGICFDCGGSGIDRFYLRQYIDSNKTI